jgi:hypothetical protein
VHPDLTGRGGTHWISGQCRADRGEFQYVVHAALKELATAELLTSQLLAVRLVSTLVSSTVSDTNDPGGFARRNEGRITTESALMLSGILEIP